MTTHLTPYEPAARIYCAMQAMDPDEMVPTPHPMGLYVEHSAPMWHQVAESMLNLSMLLVAMKQAAEAPKQAELPLNEH